MLATILHQMVISCQIFEEIPRNAILKIANSKKSIPFFNIFYKIEDMKSGMHHPDGILWIRKPSCQHSIHQDKVSLLAIAPTILELLDIPKADFMKGTALV